MMEEFYIVVLSWGALGDTYLKNLYSWTFSGYQQLYILQDPNILKAKRYKTPQGAIKAVNRLESYYSGANINNAPKVKALKVEMNIKLIEV